MPLRPSLDGCSRRRKSCPIASVWWRLPCLHGVARPICDDRISKDIAATPYRFYVMVSASRRGDFFAQVANKDINDLELGFFFPAVEVLEKHLFGYDRTLVPAEHLEQAIFL